MSVVYRSSGVGDVFGLKRKRCIRSVPVSALAAGGERFGLRVVHHSVQATHIHLIVEAEDARSLSRGMQGLSIRIAKRLNAQWGRRGAVLNDRYHARPLRTPREVRVGLLYVLNNARKHAAQEGACYARRWLDPYSSACRLDGWSTAVPPGNPTAPDGPPWVPPSSWLLRTGWRRGGLLPIAAVPSATSWR